MQTTIGQGLISSRVGLAAACAVGTLAVAADLALVHWDRQPESTEGRGALAVLVLAAQFFLVKGDLASVGLRLSPVQGWRAWVRVSFRIGLAILLCIGVGLGGWILSGREVPIYVTAPDDIGPTFLRMCFFAPVTEEVTYRLALCVPLAALLGPWGTIAVSGLAFGGLHLAYGNPSPENLVGGFFLAWIYLKGGSIALPVLLHGLGNLCALAGQVGTWYWLQGGV